MRILSICLAAEMAAVFLFGCDISKNENSREDIAREVMIQSHRFDPVIDALNKYYVQNGRYPLALGGVVSALPNVVVPEGHPTLEAIPLSYEVSRDRSFFRLTYGLGSPVDSDLSEIAIYYSPVKKWGHEYWGGFANIEANYYGDLFAKTGKSTYLELTVSSLLDAAKNQRHQCRNFWGGSVNKALGPGHDASNDFLRLPNLPAHQEARMYVPTDKGPSYVFLLRDQTFLPMSTKPYPIVSAVYRSNDKKNKEWVLYRQCDSSARNK